MSHNWLRAAAGGLALAVVFAALPAFAQKDEKGKTTFEVYQDKAKEWRWRYKAANGLIIATPGEGYKAKADAMKGIESVQKGVEADKPKVEFYKDKKDEHRWRLEASNGNIIAVSSEGYKEKAGAEKGFEVLRAHAKTAKVVEAEEKNEK